jgi:hypothetical protein
MYPAPAHASLAHCRTLFAGLVSIIHLLCLSLSLFIHDPLDHQTLHTAPPTSLAIFLFLRTIPQLLSLDLKRRSMCRVKAEARPIHLLLTTSTLVGWLDTLLLTLSISRPRGGLVVYDAFILTSNTLPKKPHLPFRHLIFHCRLE